MMQHIFIWVLLTALVEFFIAPLGADWYDATFPDGLPVLEQYQQGYATILVIGFALGAMVAFYWPSLFGWRADERQYRKALVDDVGALRNQLAFVRNSLDAGDMPPMHEIEFLSNSVEAVELPLRKRGFAVPWLDFNIDPVGYIERYRDYFQTIGPLMAVGHYKEAKSKASAFVDDLDPQFMRTDGLAARQKKRRRKAPSA